MNLRRLASLASTGQWRKKLVLLTALVSTLSAYCSAEQTRSSELANKGWTFFKGSQTGAEAISFDDSSWEQVNLPHSASIPYWMEVTVYEGDTWYRKDFEVPAELQERQAYVEFEGAFQHSWVYLNGQLLGEHKGVHRLLLQHE